MLFHLLSWLSWFAGVTRRPTCFVDSLDSLGHYADSPDSLRWTLRWLSWFAGHYIDFLDSLRWLSWLRWTLRWFSWFAGFQHCFIFFSALHYIFFTALFLFSSLHWTTYHSALLITTFFFWFGSFSSLSIFKNNRARIHYYLTHELRYIWQSLFGRHLVYHSTGLVR